MDTLIHECDAKFTELFTNRKCEDIKIEQYVEKAESGHFRLNSLVEMDAHLVKDGHFQEMVQDVDNFCSPAFAEEAKGSDRFYVIVAGSIRSLLRECISFNDPFQRKLMIEKVYTWYREKRRLLLDFRIKQKKDESTSTIARQQTGGESSVLTIVPPTNSPKLSSAKEERIQQGRKDDEEGEIVGQISRNESQSCIIAPEKISEFSVAEPDIPYYISVEKKRQIFINHKLKQYNRRSLNSSTNIRETDKGIELEDKEQNPEQKESVQRARRYAYLLRDPTLETQDIEPEDPDLENKVNEQAKNLSYMYYKQPQDSSHVNMSYQWVKHRATEAQETLEQIDFRDAVNSWNSNHARVEEEIHRRQESLRFSSQTGLRVHKIIRHSDLTKEKQERLRKRQLIDLRYKSDDLLNSDSDEEIPTDNCTEKGDSPRHHNNTSTEELMTSRTVDSVFLSPYNNLNEIRDISLPSTRLGITRSTLLSSRTYNKDPFTDGNSSSRLPSARMLCTPSSWKLLKYPQFQSSNETEMMDITAASPFALALTHRSHTGFNRPDTALTAMNTETPLSTQPHYHRTLETVSNEQIVVHSVLDEMEKMQQEKQQLEKSKAGDVNTPLPSKKDKPSGKKTPAKKEDSQKGKKKKKSSKKKSKKSEGSATPVNIDEPQLQPPSLLRSVQMDQCELIKISLSRKGINVPASIIQRTLMIPDDISYQDCMQYLPKPGRALISDIIQPEKKSRATSGKKKKKKKKS